MTTGSFLDGLDPDARELLLSAARPVSFMASAVLVHQGEPAKGAWILRAGSVDATVEIPGGESLTVASLGAGSIFGEMALVDLGTCSATVRATAPVDGWFVAHEDFRALATQSSAAAVRLQHAITSILADRIAALNAKLLAWEAPEDRPARPARAGVDPLAGVGRSHRAPFDAASFLPRLPVFEHCSADEIDEIASCGRYLELARGRGLFAAGTAAAAAFIVVRGAVEIVALHAGRERRIAVLGPGQLVGHLSALRRTAHSTHAFARETAVLLEIGADDFHALYFGDSRASARLRHAVQSSLLAAMARTNRSLTRLVSLTKLAAGRRHAAELEAALAAQIATASPL